MIKKIYAVISEKDFYNFRHRAYQEGLKMGEAFQLIICAYASGARIDLKKFTSEKHHKSTGTKYGEQSNFF